MENIPLGMYLSMEKTRFKPKIGLLNVFNKAY
jgi:hypothetical protein